MAGSSTISLLPETNKIFKSIHSHHLLISLFALLHFANQIQFSVFLFQLPHTTVPYYCFLSARGLGHEIIEIKKSNLPKEIQWDLTDLLTTAQIQINEARDMGWLP